MLINMKKTLACLGLFMAVAVMAQDKQAIKYAKTITEGDLKAHLSILASDEYEGRETGKKGQKMAAKYISDNFMVVQYKDFTDRILLTKNSFGFGST